MKIKRVKLKRSDRDPMGNPPKAGSEWFEVLETKNVIDPLPGDVIDAVALGRLVQNPNIDVVVVKGSKP